MSSTHLLLDIQDLCVQFRTRDGLAKALNGVTLQVFAGGITGLVGETGSGKSMTALSILRLVEPPGETTGGHILLEGRDLLRLTSTEMAQLRGKTISIMFQDARAALNPLMTVGQQVSRLLRLHQGCSKREASKRAIEMLRLVDMPDPQHRLRSFPHELSSGMCQRVMVVMALCGNPRLVIADEPTTGLDMTVQSQVLDLIASRVKALRASCLFITHDLGIVAKMCDSVAVMYAGRVVEYGSIADIFRQPRHPYTQGLLISTLRLDKKGPLLSIPGIVPDALHAPPGCPFHPRCSYAGSLCREQVPALIALGHTHKVSCHLVSGAIPGPDRELTERGECPP